MCPGLLKMKRAPKSSAKRAEYLMLVEFARGISLIIITNKRGPRTDPWGTEHDTGKVTLVELSILTLKVRSVSPRRTF